MGLSYSYDERSRTHSTGLRVAQSNAVRRLDNLLAEVGYPTSYVSVALHVSSGRTYVFYPQGAIKGIALGSASRLGSYSQGIILTKSLSGTLQSIIGDLVQPARNKFKEFEFNTVLVHANGDVTVSYGGLVNNEGVLGLSQPNAFAVVYKNNG